MTQNQKKSEKASGNLLNVIMFRYFPYWPLFILLLVVSFSMAWVYLRYYSIPQYRATATILIKDEKKGVEDSRSLETLSPINTK